MTEAPNLPPTPSPALPFPLHKIDQIAMVVRDLDAAVHAYWERLGVGPWTIVTFGPETVRELEYRGRPSTFSMRAAFAMTENVQLEIIESLAGPNIYEEFLEADGEGGFAYFETGGLFGTLVELIELPRRRTATATAYPPDA